MRRQPASYVMLLLIAVFTTGAVEQKTQAPTDLSHEEYRDADDWFKAGVALNAERRYREAADAFEESPGIAGDRRYENGAFDHR